MESENRKRIKLTITPVPSFMPIAVALVEKTALAFGLEQNNAFSLTLATEELFLYLCETASGKEVEIEIFGGGYFVRVEFKIPVENLNLRVFNFATSIKPEEEDSLEVLGLFLASRSVDRFQVWEEKGRGLHLSLIKEKTYPAAQETVPNPAVPLLQFSLRAPNREEIKSLARMAIQYYPSQVLPAFFGFPGKVVDMAAEGDFKALIAVDSQGNIGGGILWYWRNDKIVGCSGPFLFNQPKDSSMAEVLMEALLNDIARTSAEGLLSHYPTPDLPTHYFESLGAVPFFPKEGAPFLITAYYRHLQEDPGSMVWSHDDLTPFLEEEFKRRMLPRTIRSVTSFGEGRNPYSVISTRFDRGRDLVILQPMRPGGDQEQNLADHHAFFKKEGWRNIFFEMDLAKPWQVEFTPALFKNQFFPRLLLPYAGEGDVVIFQAEGI